MIRRIGRYEIEAELGSGGFGQVFRANDPTVGRQVAIKVLKAGAEPELFTRFRNEAAAAGRLRHQNIVIVYDFGEQDGTPYLVMELLDGEDLDRVIGSRRPLNLSQKLDVMVQAAAGLHHAHSNGIVHRDIKPANIMLCRDGVVKIMDFGIALLTQATAARLTRQGDLLGTFAYMAPEHFSPMPSSDTLSDVFAFGSTFYKLLCGVHPFEPATKHSEIATLIYNVINKTPAPLRDFLPECPEALEQVVSKLLAKDRDSRYQTFEDVRFDLEPIILDLRKDRVNQLLREVQGLIADDQSEAAQSLLRQVLELDPANRGARDLREKLQRLIRAKAVRPQIDTLVTSGQENLHARNFADAIQKFESALQLDKSNPAIHALIDQARNSWEQAQRADRLVQEARSALDCGDLSGAHDNLEAALATDSEHAAAAQLMSTVRRKIEAREHDRRLREGLNQVHRLIILKSFPEAIEALRKIQTEYPESSDVVQLLKRAQEEQEALARRQRLQTAMEEAQGLLRRRSFVEAAERLRDWKLEFPESAELAELYSYAEEELRAQKQAEEVAGEAAEARRLLEKGDYDGALQRLGNALSEHPGASELRDLLQTAGSAKAESQRRAALNLTLDEAKARIAEQRFVEALDRIAAFVRAYGESASLEPLRKQADAGLEQQRRLAAIRKLVGDAKGLLEEGRTETATQVLQQANVQFPDDPNVTELLNVAEGRLRDQQRSNAVSKVVTEAESFARAYQFERALELLDEGLKQYPGEQRVQRCREAVTAARATHERELLRQQALEEAQRLRSAGKLPEALEAINSALKKTGADAGLLDLKLQIEADRAERLRTEELQGVIAKAENLLGAGQNQAAEQLLLDATQRYPKEEKIAGLKDVAASRLREQQRAKAIAEALLYAEDERVAKRFDNALRLLDTAIEQQGPEDALRRARELVLTEKLAIQRKQTLAQVRVQVSELRSAGRLSDALRKIEGALQFLGEDAELSEAKRQIELEQEAQRRAEAVRDALRQAQDHLDRNQTPLASQVLQTALSTYPGEERLFELLGVVDARLRDEQRERDIGALVQRASQLASEKRFEEALRAVDDGLKTFPDARRFAQLRESVLAAQVRAESLDQARRLHQQNDFEAALRVIADSFGASAAADPEIQNLKIRIESDHQKQQKAEATRQVLEQAQVLARDGRLEDAIAALRAAAHQYPDEAQISALLRECEEKLRREERERELQNVQGRITALLREGKQEEAIALIEGQYPQEPRFRELLAHAREELNARKRDEMLHRASLLHQEARHQEALDMVTQAIQRYGSIQTAVELQKSARDAMEQQQRREARQRDYERLLAIERQVTAESRKRKLKALSGEAQRIANGYATDDEVAQILIRIDTAVSSALAASAVRQPFPWKTVGAGVAGAAVAIAAGLILMRMPHDKASVLTPSEIRTDPLGAAVQVGDRSCTTPNCRFELPPGQYQVQARLQGYQSAQGTLVVEPGKHSGVLNMKLEPVPVIATPKPQLGTLVVQAGEPNVEVFIDGVPSGSTDARGNFSLPTEAKTHAVRVEKTGYQTPPEQHIQLAAGMSQKVIFSLKSEVATAKSDVAANTKPLPPTRSQPSPSQQPPAQQPPQQTPTQQQPQPPLPANSNPPPQQQTSLVTPPTLPQPDPEARDWEQLRRTDPLQLQDFLQKYPNGPHKLDAQALLDDLVWKGTNHADPDSLRAYLNRSPKGAHAEEASSQLAKILDQLQKQRVEDERLSRESKAILQVLDAFNAAFERKQPRELRLVWPDASKVYLDAMNVSGASFVMTLRLSGKVQITGASAVAPCELVTKSTGRGQSNQTEKAVRVLLAKTGDRWLIVDPLSGTQ
jgi:serine/threonine protein kinase